MILPFQSINYGFGINLLNIFCLLWEIFHGVEFHLFWEGRKLGFGNKQIGLESLEFRAWNGLMAASWIALWTSFGKLKKSYRVAANLFTNFLKSSLARSLTLFILVTEFRMVLSTHRDKSLEIKRYG